MSHHFVFGLIVIDIHGPQGMILLTFNPTSLWVFLYLSSGI